MPNPQRRIWRFAEGLLVDPLDGFENGMAVAGDAGARAAGGALFQRDELAFQEGVNVPRVQFNVSRGVLDEH